MSWKITPHESHLMSDDRTEILAPNGTERFYLVRECKRCGAGQAEHPAGNFHDEELLGKCENLQGLENETT
jgi:hypothetical protein